MLLIVSWEDLYIMGKSLLSPEEKEWIQWSRGFEKI
jgi:hypothetical protein